MGGGTNPLTEKKFVKKNGKCNKDDFLQVLLKSSWTTFKTTFEALSALGTIIGGVVYKKSMIFKVFGVYVSEFLILLLKSSLVVRSYRVLVANIKIFIMDALVTLGTRLKVPILAIF